MQKFKCIALATLGLSISLASCAQTEQSGALKQQLEKQGYNFVKQIDAPEGLIGWSGYKDEYPSTVFISKDQKYYIVGDLFDAKNKNLTEEAINTHVKGAVLEQIWKSLEQTTWIQDGKKDAAKIVYVFTDVNCPYCHTFWQKARPWVDSGKVQFRHIMVGVIRENSKGQAATILASSNPEEAFKQFNLANGKNQIKDMASIPQALSDKLNHNAETMEKYGFYATPAIVWKNAKGEIESQQGMPKDLNVILD